MGGCNSLQKTLKDNKYYIITFDIVKNFNQTFIKDFTSENIIEYLKMFPKPNIIVASPNCASFSRAAAMSGGNASYRVIDNILYERPESDYVGTRYNYQRQLENSIIGRKLVENTISIIDYFKPDYWYIENPASSLMWKYIRNNLKWDKGVDNIAYYCSYGFNYKKPTNFLSNINLDLKTDINGELISFEYAGNGIDRSAIPTELLKDIFSKFKVDLNENRKDMIKQ